MTKPALDIDALLDGINMLRRGGVRPADVFEQAGSQTVTDNELLEAVRTRIAIDPSVVPLWQGWSWDKRWTPSPYLDGLEVGHYDAGKHHVRWHPTAEDACADFVLTEVRWIVEGRIVDPK